MVWTCIRSLKGYVTIWGDTLIFHLPTESDETKVSKDRTVVRSNISLWVNVWIYSILGWS